MNRPSWDNPEDFPKMRELRSVEATLIVRDIKYWLHSHGQMINRDDSREIAKLTGVLSLYIEFKLPHEQR
jgi:hypothetical protein